MASEILFTEEGEVRPIGTNALQQGVDTNVEVKSKVKGEDNKFPSGDNVGRGTMTLKANGEVVAKYEGKLRTPQGEEFPWDSDEMSNKGGSGKIKGKEKVRVRGLPQQIQIEMDTEMDLNNPPWKFRNTGYRK